MKPFVKSAATVIATMALISPVAACTNQKANDHKETVSSSSESISSSTSSTISTTKDIRQVGEVSMSELYAQISEANRGYKSFHVKNNLSLTSQLDQKIEYIKEGDYSKPDNASPQKLYNVNKNGEEYKIAQSDGTTWTTKNGKWAKKAIDDEESLTTAVEVFSLMSMMHEKVTSSKYEGKGNIGHKYTVVIDTNQQDYQTSTTSTQAVPKSMKTVISFHLNDKNEILDLDMSNTANDTKLHIEQSVYSTQPLRLNIPVNETSIATTIPTK